MNEHHWKVFIPERVDKELSKLPPEIRERIERAMMQLARNPFSSGVEKMEGEPERWRLRVGKYRIVFRIEKSERTVVVTAIGHRRDVYRRR
ncbi:MAG: type II toxin-antitoxin system RelE family toxin [Armatimonadota bacterium]